LLDQSFFKSLEAHHPAAAVMAALWRYTTTSTTSTTALDYSVTSSKRTNQKEQLLPCRITVQIREVVTTLPAVMVDMEEEGVRMAKAVVVRVVLQCFSISFLSLQNMHKLTFFFY
jgi:hypothetical protein